MTQDELKLAVAREAIKYVVDDAWIGVGSGSTANFFIDELAKRKNRILGAVASSVKTAERLKAHGIPIEELNNVGTLPVYIDNMRKSYSASAIVVTLQTQDDGASLRGRLISGLPDSALDTLRPGNQTNRAGAYHVADRTLFPARQLVSGREELSVAVKTDALGAAGAIGAIGDRPPTSAR